MDLRYLLATDQFIDNNELPRSIVEGNLLNVDQKILEELGTFTTNQDCLAVLKMPDNVQRVDFKDHVVVLDGVSDPGNLGTIIRTMDWFGIRHLVCSLDTADFYNPKVINATMGSFARVIPYYTDVPTFLADCPLPAFGADLHGVNAPDWQSDGAVALVMGSESHGISSSLAQHLEGKVTIPRIGEAESLNVAIATGILCHHMRFNFS
nr:RNA methyltransferase [Marinoscillum furvescens]